MQRKKIYTLKNLSFLQNSNLNIGILGGSFNPAHNGHSFITQQAINYYAFDYVIWLVARQNPMKAQYTQSMEKRCSQALKINSDPRIIISDAEESFGNSFIYNSLFQLANRFKSNKFTWLMGADNIKNFHLWYNYEKIIENCDIIVFDRPVETRYQNFLRFHEKFKTILAKKKSGNIIFHKGQIYNIASSNII